MNGIMVSLIFSALSLFPPRGIKNKGKILYGSKNLIKEIENEKMFHDYWPVLHVPASGNSLLFCRTN